MLTKFLTWLRSLFTPPDPNTIAKAILIEQAQKRLPPPQVVVHTEEGKRLARIAVAKDVLEVMAMDALIVAEGNAYIHRQGFDDTFSDDPTYDALKMLVFWEQYPDSRVIAQCLINERCEVCALGALMLSKVRIFNEYNFRNRIIREGYAGQSSVTSALNDVFTKAQLTLIENTFEKNNVFGHFEDAENFGKRFPLPTDRLRAIMENIIQNDGTFIPSQVQMEV